MNWCVILRNRNRITERKLSRKNIANSCANIGWILMSATCGTEKPNGMRRAFSAWYVLRCLYDPRALPWAGMKQTFGLKRDESAPNSKAKPAGVRGAEICLLIVPTPPSDPALAHFVALDTASPYVLEHEAAHAGKLARSEA